MVCRCQSPSEIRHSTCSLSSNSERIRYHHRLFSKLVPMAHLPSLALEEIKMHRPKHVQPYRTLGVLIYLRLHPKGRFLHNVWNLRSSFILHREISYSTKSAVLNVRYHRKFLNPYLNIMLQESRTWCHL